MLAAHINLVFAKSLSLLSRKPKVGFTGRRRTGVGEMAMSDTRNTLLTGDILTGCFMIEKSEIRNIKRKELEDAGSEGV